MFPVAGLFIEIELVEKAVSFIYEINDGSRFHPYSKDCHWYKLCTRSCESAYRVFLSLVCGNRVG